MGIKFRDGRAYFYDNARQGGRVVSRYLAAGDLAIAMAVLDRERRDEARAKGDAWKADVEKMRAEDSRAAELSGLVDDLVRQALEAAGYHRHRRGQWRKRRDGGHDMAKHKAPDGAGVAVPADADGRLAIWKRARAGDHDVLPVVKAMFDETPALVAFFGDLAAHVEKNLVTTGAGNDVAVREGLERKVKALRDELAGPHPSPIERLLAERAVICWVRLYQAEWADATSESRTFAQADFHRRRIDSAHRRYLSSLKALAAVRKLALPALQLNVAENQVVVGGA